MKITSILINSGHRQVILNATILVGDYKSQNFSTFTTMEKVNIIVKYANAEKFQIQILKENKKKAGIYLWTNNINGNQYVGSGVKLERRLREYFNKNYLERNKSMRICCALLKYDY